MNWNRQGEGLEGICLGEVRKGVYFSGPKIGIGPDWCKKTIFCSKGLPLNWNCFATSRASIKPGWKNRKNCKKLKQSKPGLNWKLNSIRLDLGNMRWKKKIYFFLLISIFAFLLLKRDPEHDRKTWAHFILENRIKSLEKSEMNNRIYFLFLIFDKIATTTRKWAC